MLWLAIGVLVTIAVPGGAVFGGTAEPVLLADMDGGGGGVNIDLAVRQVTVAPVRAHVGDVVHVDVVIENKAEGSRTTSADLLVNGKVVASQLFTWGWSPGERLYRLVVRLGHPEGLPRRVPDRGTGLRLGGYVALR